MCAMDGWAGSILWQYAYWALILGNQKLASLPKFGGSRNIILPFSCHHITIRKPPSMRPISELSLVAVLALIHLPAHPLVFDFHGKLIKRIWSGRPGRLGARQFSRSSDVMLDHCSIIRKEKGFSPFHVAFSKQSNMHMLIPFWGQPFALCSRPWLSKTPWRHISSSSDHASRDTMACEAMWRPYLRATLQASFFTENELEVCNKKLDTETLSDFNIIWKTRYLTAVFVGFEFTISFSAIVLTYTLYAQVRVYCQDFLRNESFGQRNFSLRHPDQTFNRIR